MSEGPRVSRRALLVGGAAALAAGAAGVIGIEAGLLPGRTTLHTALGLNGPAGSIPDIEPGPFVTGSFVSAARLGVTCRWSLSYPAGSSPGDALPLVVALHGVGGTSRSVFSQLGLDRFQAAAASPFAIASVDGGHSYYHPRASGEDAGAMVTDELLPLLADQGLDTERIGFYGWSMGGYGSLRLASALGPDRVAAVAVSSPAMWVDAAHAADGAFDDADDYAEHLLAGRQGELDGIPLLIDCGLGDGFYPTVRDYVAGFDTAPAGGFEQGGHDAAYWSRVAPAQLEFLGRHLA
jgi:dienelactone hydrolase